MCVDPLTIRLIGMVRDSDAEGRLAASLRAKGLDVIDSYARVCPAQGQPTAVECHVVCLVAADPLPRAFCASVGFDVRELFGQNAAAVIEARTNPAVAVARELKLGGMSTCDISKPLPAGL